MAEPMNGSAPPRRPAAAGLAETLPRDLVASAVVFLVALPLCLGVAQASEVPLAAGLLTGLVGGLVVGAISGSPLQVSGPPAGLIVLVLQMEPSRHPGLLGAVVLLAGLMQLAMGFAKLGQWFRAVSPAVIQGMLAGIGVIILASQFHAMAGVEFRKEYIDPDPISHFPGEPDVVPHAPNDPRPHERGEIRGLDYLYYIPQTLAKAWSGDPRHATSLALGALTVAVILAWKAFAPRAWQVLPGSLVAVVVAIAVAQSTAWPVGYVNVPRNLFGEVVWPTRGALFLDPRVWGLALTVALVASAETLLCASAVDSLAGTRTDYNREMSAQGVGNSICGVLGSLPMTGVIVRSATNVEAGAKTRLSAVLHGLWILLFVTLMPGVLNLIPTAALAAILVYTGFKLVDVKVARSLFRVSRSELAIYLATVAAIVGTDLLVGVIVGVVLAMLKLLYTFSHLVIRTEDHPPENRTVMDLEGAATFVRLPQLAAALEAVRPDTELRVSFERLTYIDHACLELLVNWEKQHEASGGSLVVEWDTLWARFKAAGNGRPAGVPAGGPPEPAAAGR